MKINESTKVTLTLKQLRQLVKESLYSKYSNENIYIAQIKMSFMKQIFDMWKDHHDPVYYALADLLDRRPGVRSWTILETLPYDDRNVTQNHPKSIHSVIAKATKKAQRYEKANPDMCYVVFYMGAVRLNVMWKSQNLETLEDDSDDADVITDTDFAEVVDELEYQLLDNEGCADLKDDSGIEKFREKVVYPAVNAFFNAGKTVEDKEEIMDFVKGKPNPYKFYRDKDPYEDG
jgi:hypothetical protein